MSDPASDSESRRSERAAERSASEAILHAASMRDLSSMLGDVDASLREAGHANS